MRTPVVFLHGWTMNGRVFDDLAQRLGPGFDCHAPDLPGHGTAKDADPTLEGCAEVARHCIDGLERPILVGWSMGAGAAWRYVARHGTEALRGLVTIDMSPRILPDADWSLGMIGQSAQAILHTTKRIEPDWPRMAKSIANTMFAPQSKPVLSRSEVDLLLRAQDPARLRPLWQALIQMDERATIATIDLPYLICTGAQSHLYSFATAQWIAAQAPSAEIKRFTQSGHSPHLEEPEAFCAALKGFAAAHGLSAPLEDQERT